MQFSSKIIIFVLLLNYSVISYADKNKPNDIDYELNISGLLIDDTLTKPGHDFYDIFNQRFSLLEFSGYNVTISESGDITRRLIIVSLNDRKIFEAFLKPKYDDIEESVNMAFARMFEVILLDETVSSELEGL